jgi:hypothetical protein
MSVPSAEQFIASFPNQLPKHDGKPTYEILKNLKSLLKGNAATVPTERGGGAHGYLGTIVSVAAYANIAPLTPFDAPVFPGAAPAIPPGSTGPAIQQIVQAHTEQLRDWREHTNVCAALKKQFLNAIEPVYLRSQKDRNTGFANISIGALLAFSITTYGKITPTDLSNNEAAIKKSWDANTPFEILLDQIEDCQEFADDGQQPFTDRQILNTAYTLVFNTGVYFDDCKTWNAKAAGDKTWDNFKTHFLEAQETLRLQQATSQQAGFHNANAARQHQGISHEMYEETAEALANLATATSSDRKALETLTNTVANLTQQVQEKDKRIKTLSDQIKNKTNQRERTPRQEPTDNGSYCWSHGYKIHKDHNSANCRFQKPNHKKEATRANNMSGSQEGKP